jgi:hypothetical protein
MDLSEWMGKLTLGEAAASMDISLPPGVDPTDVERGYTRGEGAAEAPIKTIVLLISLHGENLDHEKLDTDLPVNIRYSVPPNICNFLFVSTKHQKKRIQKLRSKGSVHEIVDAYIKESPVVVQAIKAKADMVARGSMTRGTPGEFLTHLRKIQDMPTYFHKYSSSTDHHYICDTKPNADIFSNGIFIIGANFEKDNLLRPVELPKQKHYKGNFLTGEYDASSAKKLQTLNLLNLPVLRELSKRVIGREFVLTGKHLNINMSRTGIEHYHESRLSHYLDFCKKLGAEKVILIDETCRVGSYIPDLDKQERRKAAAAEPGSKNTKKCTPTEMRDKGSDSEGGKRTRRRSRRFHKKS